VLERSGTSWIEQDVLTPSAPQEERFGASVALADGATALIGSTGRQHSGFQQAGAVYVFVNDGSAWTQQDMLVASDPGECYYFGMGLSVSGDRFITGAYGSEQGGEFAAGSAYIFLRDDNGTADDPADDSWSEETKLTRSGAVAWDRFGSAVALEGTVAVVGAMGVAHSGLSACGAAYVFEYDGSAWNEVDELVASDAGDTDLMGMLAVGRDSGVTMVGAQYHDHGGVANCGAVYVYQDPPSPPLPGDLNCDGRADFDDIDPFVLALTGRAAYEAEYPGCPWLNADCNSDGNVDFADIDWFVALLASGG
jgi:hypothetical protein